MVTVEEGAAVLPTPLEGPAVRLGASLEPLAPPAGSTGLARRLFALPEDAPASAPVYLDGRLLRRGSSPAVERAERVFYRCLEEGLSFKVSAGSVLTLSPPLTITHVPPVP